MFMFIFWDGWKKLEMLIYANILESETNNGLSCGPKWRKSKFVHWHYKGRRRKVQLKIRAGVERANKVYFHDDILLKNEHHYMIMYSSS